MSIADRMATELGDKPTLELSTSALQTGRSSGDGPFTRANAIDTREILDWLGVEHDGRHATCVGCGEPGALICENGGCKCQHDRCGDAGPPNFPGFRTNVDLVAAERNIVARDAVTELCERFGIGTARASEPNSKHSPALRLGIPCTDYGNAERLVGRYRDRIRWCPPRRKWLIWNGKRWQWDETGLVIRLAKKAVRAIYPEAAKSDNREDVAKWAMTSEHEGRLKAMMLLAQSEVGIPVLPIELDADPMLFNVKNGTIDLRTGELRAHDRGDLITKLSPVEYDPDATNETWERFLHDASSGDEELQSYLRRVAGYCLTGRADEKKFFFIFGPRDTAKSTFIDALSTTWGSYAVSADFSTWLVQSNSGGNRGDLVRLAGARFVSSVEVRKGAKWDEALLKRVVGGDEIVAAAKYEAEQSFRATFKLLLAANDAPVAREDDDGLWSRMRRIPFTQQIKKRDSKVKETLKNPNVAGPTILAWAVRGCLEWQRDGLGTAPIVDASTAAYRKEVDQIGEFFDECIVFENDEYITATRRELRAVYDDWCRENGIKHALGTREFTARIRDRGGVDGKNGDTRYWKNVRLLGPDEEPARALEGSSGTSPLKYS